MRIRIGTRGSPLALYQANATRDRLAAAHGLAPEAIEIVVIRTSGDRIQDRPLADAGGKGLFTKEIEDALIAREIDIAVHSMKDVPTVLPEGLGIAAMLPRADVRDAFISLTASSLDDLPAGAAVGTSSLRRQAQVRRIRPDLRIIPFRGNVETRLRKLAEGEADATLLAVAGLERLGMAERITSRIEPEVMLPAVAQGAIGLEMREGDAATLALAIAIGDTATMTTVAAERGFLTRLDGSCRTPIAALATLTGSRLALHGMILSPDGRRCFEAHREGPAASGPEMGRDAAEEVLARAGPDFRLDGRQ